MLAYTLHSFTSSALQWGTGWPRGLHLVPSGSWLHQQHLVVLLRVKKGFMILSTQQTEAFTPMYSKEVQMLGGFPPVQWWDFTMWCSALDALRPFCQSSTVCSSVPHNGMLLSTLKCIALITYSETRTVSHCSFEWSNCCCTLSNDCRTL